jgi:hypothetical protein
MVYATNFNTIFVRKKSKLFRKNMPKYVNNKEAEEGCSTKKP